MLNIAFNNFLIKNNQSYKLQKTLTSSYLNNVFERLVDQDWQHKNRKLGHNTLAQKSPAINIPA